jgi:hypothetical protein
MPPYGNSMLDNEGHCWKKQKEPLLIEAGSTQKAICEPKIVLFNVIKKICSLHYKNVKTSFLLPERQNMNEGTGNDQVARDISTTFQNH